MPTILLLTAWQTCNIGDICFTPAMLLLLKKYVPEAKIIAWGNAVNDDVRALCERVHPNLEWVQGGLGWQGQPADEAVLKAFERVDLVLYNSGPLMHYRGGVQTWDYFIHNSAALFYAREKGIPFAIYAQSFEAFAPPSDILARDIFSSAVSLTCRDGRSLRLLRQIGVKAKHLDFSPDAAFAFDLLNEEAAVSYLAGLGLKDQQFLAATIHYGLTNRAGVVERGPEYFQKFASVLDRWVEETGLPVLVTPEDDREIQISRERLLPLLKPETTQKTHLRETFWMPDEALSVNRRARALFSMEPHSQIMALAQGVPCVHATHWIFGLKAEMWRDLGLGDWLFDLAEDSPEVMTRALLEIHQDHDAAVRRVQAAMIQVHEKMTETFGVIRGAL